MFLQAAVHSFTAVWYFIVWGYNISLYILLLIAKNWKSPTSIINNASVIILIYAFS